MECDSGCDFFRHIEKGESTMIAKTHGHETAVVVERMFWYPPRGGHEYNVRFQMRRQGEKIANNERDFICNAINLGVVFRQRDLVRIDVNRDYCNFIVRIIKAFCSLVETYILVFCVELIYNK